MWTRASRLHYQFVQDLASALCREYRLRFQKTHKSEELIHGELRRPPAALTISKWTEPPLAMPDEFKSDDLVESYQRYYASKNDKMLMRWNRGRSLPPFWFSLRVNEIAYERKEAA